MPVVAINFRLNGFFHFRWTNKRKTEDYYKLTIQFDTVGGRTSAYVPQRQMLSNDEQQQVHMKLNIKRTNKNKIKENGENLDEPNNDRDNSK